MGQTIQVKELAKLGYLPTTYRVVSAKVPGRFCAGTGDREREVGFSGQVPLPRCRAQSTSTDDVVFLNQAKARAGDRTVLRGEFGG
jgi:hypothetical protein